MKGAPLIAKLQGAAVATIGLALLAPGCGPKVHTTRLTPVTIVARRLAPKPKPKPKLIRKIESANRIEFAPSKARLLSAATSRR